MSNWIEGDVESDGINIHYYRTGRGAKPPLVLAHGFTDNGLCWSRVAKQLESTFDLVMVDARNHGQSGQGSAHQRELAADLAMVITKLELAPVVAMGHSVGGSVVTALAANHPDLVARLVIEDPPWTSPHRAALKSASRVKAFREYVESLALQTQEQVMQAGMQQHPSWHAEEFAHWATSSRQVHAQAMERLELDDWAELIPLIRCPALLIYADTDKGGIVSKVIAAAVEALNPLMQTRQIADAGHNLRREAFGPFVVAVSAFLADNVN